MKRFFYLLVAMCAMAFVGCSDDDDDNGGEDNSKSKIVMEVSGEERVEISINTSKPGEIVKIDWGDGNVKEYKSDEEIEEGYSGHLDFSDYPFYIFYEYANKDIHTITIEGENIVRLGCWGGLSSLNVTCKSLIYLDCEQNNLTTLDLTKCPALMGLHCPNNKLTTLNISKCTALEVIWCYDNNLSSLDVSKCNALVTLECMDNNLTTLNVSKCTALEVIWCYDNNLSSLDVSGCTALMELSCSDNNLNVSALNKIYGDLPHDIGTIWAYNNPGYEASNKQIAIDKGWTVKEY